MKSKILLLLSVLTALGSVTSLVAQENDDMYFSRKDREKLYASTSYTSESINDSEYTDNHNFYSTTLQSTTAGSPTIQAGNLEDDNNQYFIKDYSITNKADSEVKTYSGINSNNGYSSGFNSILSFGAYYQPLYLLYCNPYTDRRSPIYDISYMHFDPWDYNFYRYNLTSFYIYRGNPRYNNYGNNYGSNGYSNISNICVTTSYSNNVRNEVRYRNGRKIIRGSRGSASRPSSDVANRDRATKNYGSKVSTNGRSSSDRSRSNYRTYTGSQNRGTSNSRSSNSSYTRSKSTSTGSSINRSSRSSRSSGSSSKSSSSGSSRSSSSRGRGNN